MRISYHFGGEDKKSMALPQYAELFLQLETHVAAKYFLKTKLKKIKIKIIKENTNLGAITNVGR